KDGTVTFEWNARDQIIIGDYEPTFNGTFGFNITYKRFNVYTSFLYEIGGDKYNQTLVSKVENINIADYNADLRVLTDRWQQIGDKTPLKNIANSLYITRPTSRFLQRNNFVKLNSLSLSYDMGSNFCKKLKMSMCRLTFSMQDIFTFSTIKQERGIFYPFSRTFNFSVNLTF
ncbi:MAG: SusC/RagA family TonB-linked outer membrane protein, partial [Clostridia bacterium]|nr:SusC/RagA family TonB-linked outer membrane protein [Clostridia bacterium]